MIDKVLQILTCEENILTLSRHGFCFCFVLFVLGVVVVFGCCFGGCCCFWWFFPLFCFFSFLFFVCFLAFFHLCFYIFKSNSYSIHQEHFSFLCLEKHIMIDKVLPILTLEKTTYLFYQDMFFFFSAFVLFLFLIVLEGFCCCFWLSFLLFVCFFGILSLVFLHIQIKHLFQYPSRTFLFCV